MEDEGASTFEDGTIADSSLTPEESRADFENDETVCDFGVDVDQNTLVMAPDQNELSFLRESFPKIVGAQWTEILSLERQPIIIEARALLGMAIDNILINWENGGESLHVVYCFEYFLHRLCEKGWNIVVSFFDVLPYDKAETEQNLLIAEILLGHLTYLAKEKPHIVEVRNFNNWWDDTWHTFVDTHHPSLVVLDLQPEPAEQPSSDQLSLQDSEKIFLLDMFLQNIRTISSDFRIDTSTIWSFELTPRVNYANSFLDSLHQNLLNIHSEPRNIPDFETSVLSQLSTNDIADQAICLAGSRVLAVGNQDAREITENFLRVYVLTHYLGRSIPLQTRAQIRSAKLAPEDQLLVKEFFAQFSTELFHALVFLKKHRNSNTLSTQEISHTADLIDGCFFSFLLVQLSTKGSFASQDSVGWSEETQKLVNTIWNLISNSSSFYPVKVSLATPIPIQQEENQENSSGATLGNFGGEFIQDIDSLRAVDNQAKKLGLLSSQPGGEFPISPLCSNLLKGEPFVYPDLQEKLPEKRTTPPDQSVKNLIELLEKEYQIKVPGDWARVTFSMIYAKGGRNILSKYKSLWKLLQHVYPENDWGFLKAKEKRWEKIQHQRLTNYRNRFSSSLEGKGLVSRHVVIARSDCLPLPPPEPEAKGAKGAPAKKSAQSGKGNRGGKGKKGHVNHKEKILASNKERMSSSDVEDVNSAIRFADEEPDLDNKIFQLSYRLQEMRSKSNPAPAAMIHGYMKLIEWSLNSWEKQCVAFEDDDRMDWEVIEGSSRNYVGAVHLIRLCYDCFDFYGEHMSPNDIRRVQSYLNTLGLPEAAEEIYNAYAKRVPANAQKAKLPKKRASALEQACSVNMSFSTFQLAHCGHLMQRSFESQPDPRVSGFAPDKWQRQLLDIVDSKQSVLVVAPTSSGKTFISYYTMKQVLEANKKAKFVSEAKLVVYVAPSKALLRQVDGEVYLHYGPVVGLDTEDYTQNFENCQVLVTVPQALERLLLNPSIANRIESCILDEIHCIEEFGTGEGGDENTAIYWEHIINLLPCPFIALSATIGNPEAFCSWLNRSQARYGRQVHLVDHRYRWADLKLQVYLPETPKEPPTFKSTLRLPEKQAIVPLHPVAGLSLFCIQANKLDGIRLAPEECLQLWSVMCRISEKLRLQEIRDELDEYDPDQYFKGIIKRLQVYHYESALKSKLLEWSNAPATAKFVDQVIDELAGTHHSKSGYPVSNRFTADHFMPVLQELFNTDRLPAIVFVLARQRCNRLALDLIQTLETAEREEKMRPGYLRKLRETLRKENKVEKDSKRKRDKEEKEIKKLQDAPDDEEIVIATNDAPLPKFSFIRRNEGVHIEDREYWINRIPKSNPTIQALIRGLDRGIAVHHSALPIQYRTAVEALFRAGHLKVVISTGTLSLGLNMPCRSVVFAGDSPLLTPLTFQQMSGRAGRRGYDDYGNVVFFGLPKHRVFTLVSAHLPHLVGSQPITPSIALRSLICYYSSHAMFRKQTAKRLEGLFNVPLYATAKDPKLTEEITRYGHWLFRIYLEFFRRIHLINSDSVPVDLAGIANDLFQVEPSNFLFAYFCLSGVLDEISSSEESLIERRNNMFHLLSHLIRPVPVSHYTAKLVRSDFTSSVVLQPLGGHAKSVLDAFQNQTLDLFVQTFRKVYDGRANVDTNRLPFSAVLIGTDSLDGRQDSLVSFLKQNQANIILRSPFYALSGLGDKFESASELATTSALHIPICADHIPVISLKDVRGRTLQFSSYALDFFKFTSKKLLVSENGFKESAVWELLKNWDTLLESLSKFNSSVKPLLGDIHEEFSAAFKRFNI